MSDDTRPDPAYGGTDLTHGPGAPDPEVVTASRATAASVPTPTAGYVLPPGEGVDARGAEVKCSNRSTGGSLAMYRTIVDGDGPPLHTHTHEDETIVVVDGSIECECGDDTWSGGPGTVFFMPRGLPHTFRSLDGPATILFLITPGHLDDFFRLRERAVDTAQVADLVRRFL
jgi:quercetin dioxygenase-like cupin family protein